MIDQLYYIIDIFIALQIKLIQIFIVEYGKLYWGKDGNVKDGDRYWYNLEFQIKWEL